MTKTIIVIICSIIITYAHAGSLERYRALKDTTIIKCSPDGKDGGELPIDAMKLLKNGMTLMLLPGVYESSIMVSQNKVIITSDGSGGFCQLELKISGKKCLIRDLKVNTINSIENLTIIDSFVDHFTYSSEKRTKPNFEFYNSYFSCISTSWYPSKFKIINCSIVNNGTNIYCHEESSFNIINSIVYSASSPLHINSYGDRKAKIILKDSLLYGKSSLAQKGKTKQALDVKSLKKIVKISIKGKTIFERPIFKKDLKSSTSSYIHIDIDTFLLKPDSPGFGKGVVYEKNICSKKIKKRGKTKIKTESQKALDKEWDDLAKKYKKETKKKKTQENDDEFGGIPLEP